MRSLSGTYGPNGFYSPDVGLAYRLAADRDDMTGLFRTLTAEDEKGFIKWARDNYDPLVKPSDFWHPVVRYTWYSLLEEHARVNRVQAQLEVEALHMKEDPNA